MSFTTYFTQRAQTCQHKAYTNHTGQRPQQGWFLSFLQFGEFLVPFSVETKINLNLQKSSRISNTITQVNGYTGKRVQSKIQQSKNSTECKYNMDTISVNKSSHSWGLLRKKKIIVLNSYEIFYFIFNIFIQYILYNCVNNRTSAV